MCTGNILVVDRCFLQFVTMLLISYCFSCEQIMLFCICCLSQKFLQVGLLLLYKCDLCVWRVGCGIFCIERSGIVTLSLSNAGNVFGGYLTIFGGEGPLVSIY